MGSSFREGLFTFSCTRKAGWGGSPSSNEAELRLGCSFGKSPYNWFSPAHRTQSSRISNGETGVSWARLPLAEPEPGPGLPSTVRLLKLCFSKSFLFSFRI